MTWLSRCRFESMSRYIIQSNLLAFIHVIPKIATRIKRSFGPSFDEALCVKQEKTTRSFELDVHPGSITKSAPNCSDRASHLVRTIFLIRELGSETAELDLTESCGSFGLY
jgi:hypothetical protein